MTPIGTTPGLLLGFVTDSKIIMYADDIVLYNSNSNYRLAERAVHMDLNVLSEWCNNDSMIINERQGGAIVMERSLSRLL